MIYVVLANFVLVLHFAFILFVGAGGLLTLIWRRTPWIHLPLAAWGVYVELSGSICPLTPLENELRRAAGEQGYAGSFIEHYLLPIIYPSGLTRDVQIALAVLVIVLNVVAYGFVYARRR